MIRVTIWNEYIHEREIESIHKIYPQGIHGCIKEFLERNEDITVRTATLDQPEHGLSEEVLEHTDVLIWWGHCAHDQVSDQIVDCVKSHVLSGMGLIALHSAHYSKIMKALLGTTMSLRWRDDDHEKLWVTSPAHPIAAGLPAMIEIQKEEMYGEYFDIPTPDDVVFTGWFAGGEVFRSGCTFTRGFGRVFYFQPGHEAYPVYYQPEIQTIITNAVRWARPAVAKRVLPDCIHATQPE